MNTKKLKLITGDITPLPWVAAYGHSSEMYGLWRKENIDKNINSAPICLISPQEKVEGKDKSNAAYIEKACNLFPELSQKFDWIFNKLNQALAAHGQEKYEEVWALPEMTEAKKLLNEIFINK